MVGGEERGHVIVEGEVDEEGGQGEETGERVGDGESDVYGGGVHACPSCDDDRDTLVLGVDE